MNIGITIGLLSPIESLWVNGIKQNAIYLMKTLMSALPEANIFLVNTTNVSLDNLSWSQDQFPVISMTDAIHRIDILFVLGGAISQEQTESLKRRNAKIVGYKCGSEYVVSMEAVLFDRKLGGEPYYNRGFDELWLVPQVAEVNSHFYEVMHRTKSRVVPFVWDPVCIESACQQLPNNGVYSPGRKKKRISIMEPNSDVVKYFLYPLMIAEMTYRNYGRDLIDLVSVTNSEKIRTNKEFLGVVSHIDLVRDRKCFFENRFETAWFLAHHTDVVISHQWGNPLNYAYLEACWLGYPLVHNATMTKEIGYYYEGFDVSAGAAALNDVLCWHDETPDEYLFAQRRHIEKFLATSPAVISQYRGLVENLIAGRGLS